MTRRPFSSQSLVLIVIAIAINMIGGQLISMLKLPIFLDSYSAAKHLIPICISFDTDKK